MSRLKISAISYLNTAPLMWDFEHAAAGAGIDFDISYTIPSACAEALRAGTADIGIVPAAAYATVPDLVIIPDVAIAARRAVRSILLVSKTPVDPLSTDQWSQQVRTVALDTSSMTSVALAKILFAKWLGGAREYKPMAPDLDAMLGACDAALLIGDPALQVDRTRYFYARPGGGVGGAYRKVIRLRFLGHSQAGACRTKWGGDCGGLQEVAGSWSVAEET